MRDVPYKRPQIVFALESLIQNGNIRDINPTTKRLVERCLGGDWCVQLRKTTHDKEALKREGNFRQCSPSHDIIASTTQDTVSSQAPTSPGVEHDSASKVLGLKQKVLKPCRSIENLHSPTSPRRPIPRSATGALRRPSADSTTSFGGVAAATTTSRRRDKANSADDITTTSRPEQCVQQLRLPPSPSLTLPPTSSVNHKARRPPPAPPKRRKPPPVPVGTTNGGATITAIATSASPSPLGQFATI